MRWFLPVMALLFYVALNGCGPEYSRVHGTVHYQGKPLARGTIVFLAVDNRAYPVKIKADGSYELARLPRGLVKVALLAAEERKPPARGAPGSKEEDELAQAKGKQDDAAKKARPFQAPKVTVALPAHFSDPESSGLSFQLELPDQEYSLNLE